MERIKDLRNHSVDFDDQTSILKYFPQSAREIFCFQFWSLESGVRHTSVARCFWLEYRKIGDGKNQRSPQPLNRFWCSDRHSKAFSSKRWGIFLFSIFVFGKWCSPPDCSTIFHDRWTECRFGSCDLAVFRSQSTVARLCLDSFWLFPASWELECWKSTEI